jgi:hypothetical protein
LSVELVSLSGSPANADNLAIIADTQNQTVLQDQLQVGIADPRSFGAHGNSALLDQASGFAIAGS